MSGPRGPVARLLDLIADHLEEFADGDEVALERLGAAIEQGDFSPDDVQSALWSLRRLGADRPTTAAVDQLPGRSAHRVLNPQERESLSPAAWGYLLDLQRRGTLDPRQFERVLQRLVTLGVRPVDVDLAHSVAVQVALAHDPEPLDPTGDGELAH